MTGRFTHLKMQMGTAAAPAVSAPPQGIPCRKPKRVFRAWAGVKSKGSPFVGALNGPRLNLGGKRLQVCVHRGDAFRTFEVQGVSVTPRGHFDPRHPPRSRGEHGNSLPPLGLQVNARVKVVPSQFPEVSRKGKRNAQRIDPRVVRAKRLGRRRLRHQPRRGRCSPRHERQRPPTRNERGSRRQGATKHGAKLHFGGTEDLEGMAYFCSRHPVPCPQTIHSFQNCWIRSKPSFKPTET